MGVGHAGSFHAWRRCGQTFLPGKLDQFAIFIYHFLNCVEGYIATQSSVSAPLLVSDSGFQRQCADDPQPPELQVQGVFPHRSFDRLHGAQSMRKIWNTSETSLQHAMASDSSCCTLHSLLWAMIIRPFRDCIFFRKVMYRSAIAAVTPDGSRNSMTAEELELL